MRTAQSPKFDASALDRDLETLQSRKDAWARMALPSRIEYLRRVLDGFVRVAERQVRAACQAKGIAYDAAVGGEEWLGGPVIQIRTVRTLIESLEYLARHGRPWLDERRVRTRPDGQVVVEVFPKAAWDRILYAGFKGEIWMEPEVTRANLRERMGSFYTKDEPPAGKVALVLGAGNVASIGSLDLVHKLFFEGQVGLLKLNPVNAYLAPFLEEIFADLIRDGFVRLTGGGAAEGEYLVQHEGVDEIHITGSDKTHDAIVWGTGKDAFRRRAGRKPRVDKRVTSELGNVTPIIVFPGAWSEADLQFQAENVATQLANNAGFNCVASRLLVTWARWPQRQAFLDRVMGVLAGLPARLAYYPGARDRFDRFLEGHPQARRAGSQDGGRLPWVVIPDLDASAEEEVCFTTEAFCSVMGETRLEAESPEAFLAAAVDFVNEKVWGTLSACLLVDPEAQRRHAGALEDAVAGLRYGTVAVNHWPALAFGLGTTTWGAFPGHTYEDIQSGIGTVHNTLLFDAPQKSVVRGPFRIRPKPPWFVTHRKAHVLGPRIAAFEADPKALRLPLVFLAALQG